MNKLTVIICSYNPRPAYLDRALESLRNQNLPKEQWELLLIDNASRSPLAKVWDLSWHPHGRHILENELGLSAARQRGMKEAASDLLVFVDDDNVLDPNYLSEVLQIKAEWPRLGVWGSGAIVPEFEIQPAEQVKRFTGYLALREVPKARWSNLVFAETIPLGAGLCVRASVADAYRRMNNESAISISGRRGKELLGGEDFEISYVACHLGLGIGVFPELRLTHLISKERVSPKYLLKICEGAVTSNVLLAYKWKGSLPKSPLRPSGLLSILKNVAIHRGLDRQIYLANVRALISARRIIQSTQIQRAVH
jgi:glycosyltransferase involved in cell wall biosynthesis